MLPCRQLFLWICHISLKQWRWAWETLTVNNRSAEVLHVQQYFARHWMAFVLMSAMKVCWFDQMSAVIINRFCFIRVLYHKNTHEQRSEEASSSNEHYFAHHDVSARLPRENILCFSCNLFHICTSFLSCPSLRALSILNSLRSFGRITSGVLRASLALAPWRRTSERNLTSMCAYGKDTKYITSHKMLLILI